MYLYKISRCPPSVVAFSDFDFTCDEEICYFEVRVFDGDENLQVKMTIIIVQGKLPLAGCTRSVG